VRREHAALRERQQAGKDSGHRRRDGEHLVGDPGEFGDRFRHRRPGIHQRRELRDYLAAAEKDRADLGDACLVRRPAGGLHVHDREAEVAKPQARDVRYAVAGADICHAHHGRSPHRHFQPGTRAQAVRTLWKRIWDSKCSYSYPNYPISPVRAGRGSRPRHAR